MLEIKKTARFITDFYGSAPAGGALKTILNWIDDKQSKALLSWADQTRKKGEEADQALERILSVFHRDDNGYPVIGNWMLKRCLIETGFAIFNAQKNKEHPKQAIIKNCIISVEPIPFIAVNNGKVIQKPDGVKTYNVSLKSRSFFKAYECINRGSEFEFTAYFDDNMISDEQINEIVDAAGRFGVGAFRERYGKFEYV